MFQKQQDFLYKQHKITQTYFKNPQTYLKTFRSQENTITTRTKII